jgi:hypothetical protein
MRVHDHRVGVSNRGEGRAQRGRRSGDQPVGAVDVEPGAVLVGDLRQVGQRVNRPGVGGAGAAHHRHRDNAITLILGDRGP